jgi:hypothetical protein
VPVHETEFARDSVFGFSTAFLPDYVEEKTGGRIKAAHVERFDLAAVRGDIGERLRGCSAATPAARSTPSSSPTWTTSAARCWRGGRRQALPVPQRREPADLLAALPPQPVAAADMAASCATGAPAWC